MVGGVFILQRDDFLDFRPKTSDLRIGNSLHFKLISLMILLSPKVVVFVILWV